MNVFLYARVSTPEQAKKDLSIPDQLRQMRDYCKQNNHIIIKEYIEPGVTATDDKRPAFQDMIFDALSKLFNVEGILVLTTSRFFRDSLEAKVYKRKLSRAKIKVIAIKQETGDGPGGVLVEGIFELIDEYESRINAFHTLRGMKENARKGYLNGASAPYGYNKVRTTDGNGNEKSKLEINPAEAEIVREIFKLYYQGDKEKHIIGAKNIAMHLNEKNIKTRSEYKWSKHSILNILANTTYAGTYYFNVRDSKNGGNKPKEEWIPIQVPAIIGKNMFGQIQEIIKKRNPQKTNPAITASPSLLLGLLKCGQCGASMTRETGKNNTYSYYNCRTFLRQGKASCPGHRIPRELLEKQVLDHLSNKIFSTERVKKLLSDLYKAYKEAKQKNAENLFQLTEQLKDIQKRLNNQYNAIEEGIVDKEDVKERIRELKKQKLQAETTIEQSRQKFQIPIHYYTNRHIKTFQQQLKKTFKSKNSTLTKNYLNTLVKHITINDNNVHIKGHIQGALQIMSQKETAAENSKKGVLTAVTTWLPREDSNLGLSGYT